MKPLQRCWIGTFVVSSHQDTQQHLHITGCSPCLVNKSPFASFDFLMDGCGEGGYRHYRAQFEPLLCCLFHRVAYLWISGLVCGVELLRFNSGLLLSVCRLLKRSWSEMPEDLKWFAGKNRNAKNDFPVKGKIKYVIYEKSVISIREAV